jgi:hypothetical protein
MSSLGYSQSNASRNQPQPDSSSIKQIAQDMMLLNAINAAGSRLTVDNYNGQTPAPSRPSAQSQRNTVTAASSINSFLLNQPNSSSNFYSEVEAAILRANIPLDLNESEEITVNGERGVWVNKNETSNWKGSLPLGQYQINDDPNPEIIRKRTDQQLQYMQEVAIRYLRPPTPPPPGEILIQKESNIVTPPAPPLGKINTRLCSAFFSFVPLVIHHFFSYSSTTTQTNYATSIGDSRGSTATAAVRGP